ncbi:MAG: phosphoribosylformylglycinamidine synthase subunit PurQ [Candidatus Goldbacteria bacterium]|nr:phosphoribosylformylglycinamidine synthase subunit PurQ [Candidatus Goldiibacteriota bacterium]
MKAGVIVFPGSNRDADCMWALQDILGVNTEYIWHENKNIKKYDLIVIPGGFSYGDYLRCGAIARFAKVMESIQEFSSKKNKFILGICNGFQILLEAGLLPGAMLMNKTLKFICRYVNIVTENNNTPFTGKMKKGQVLRIPIAHNEGNYYCDETILNNLIKNDCVVFRYSDENGNVNDNTNPNGALYNIAGIINKDGNILGMMPHPERAMIKELGSTDGRLIFESVIKYIKNN